MITPLMLLLAGYVAASAPAQAAPSPEADGGSVATDRTTVDAVAMPGDDLYERLDPIAEPTPIETPAAPTDGLALSGLSDEAVYAAAIAAMDEIDTMKARFVQTAPSGEVSGGTAYIDRPGRLRFDYDAPSAQRIVATNGLVYVQDTDLETTDSYPVSKTPLRFLLGEDVDAEGAVLTGVERGPGEVAVTLEAADEDLSGQVAMVFAVGADEALTLSRWAVFDPRGGVTVVALEDQVFGDELPRRLFRAPRSNDRFLDRR